MLEWVKFWTLALIWGSSFLLIKVAVEDLGALPLVSIRLGGAALLFIAYLMWTRRGLPSNRREQYALLFVGIFNTAVPFALISWGETRIDSGLATVLNSTVPLFGLIFAHFVLADERLTGGKLLGLLIGFLGVIVITSRNLSGDSGNFLGQGAVLLASGFYAVSIVSIRFFLRKVDPFTVAGWSTIIGAVAIVSATLISIRPLPSDVSLLALGVAVILACVNTFIAYFLAFDLIDKWGARATLVTYAMPPIGVTLGYLFLDEQIGWQLLVGAVMIIGGIVLARSQAQAAPRIPVEPVAQPEVIVEGPEL